MENKKLYRNKENSVIAGVCSGIAEHQNMDVSTVRILAVLIVLFTGIGIIPYIVLAIILPEKSTVVSQEEPYHAEENKKEDDLYEYDEEEYKI